MLSGCGKQKKTHDRVFFYYPSRACASLDISLSRVTLCVCVCVCVCAVCESVHEHVCVRAGRSVI